MNDIQFMRDVLQRIATGPTLSKDLSRQEAQRAMSIVLDGKADEVQAGIFLIALRMKRETDDELAGILDAINSQISRVPLSIEHLLTIVDPYDGYLRGTPAGPFLPSVLAACGVQTLTHGVMSMGPKFGASHEGVLSAAGLSLPQTLQEVANSLQNPECGWCYVSQSILSPSLSALRSLRTRIVKRPCLTTIEVAINAFAPRVGNHLATGFVHKPYPPIYAKLAKEGGFDSAILVRGVEGGVIPSLTQGSRYFYSNDGESLLQTDIDPAQLNINRQERAVPLPEHLADDAVRSVKSPDNPFANELNKHAAQSGLAALEGEPGYTRDSLVYAAAILLRARALVSSLPEGARLVRSVLDSGEANARFGAMKTLPGLAGAS